MFKLNLKIAWRNLWKNKVYAAINIGGLALGLTAFVLMLLYINHEESYDTWSSDLKNVYQLREFHSYNSPDNKQYWQTANESRNASLLIQTIPQIKSITKVESDWYQNFALTVQDHAPAMIRGIRDADSSFFNVMPYKFVYGDKSTSLQKPNSIVLKRWLAKQLFGHENVLGKTIKMVRWEGDKLKNYTVTGIIEEPQTPQNINFSGIIHTGRFDEYDENLTRHKYIEIYAKIETGNNLNQLNINVKNVYTNNLKKTLAVQNIRYIDYLKAGNIPDCKFIPIAEAHQNPPFTASWIEKIKPVALIITFLLLISIINFINLTIAQSFQRAKEVGVRKVLGAGKSLLVKQFLCETALQSLCALLLSVILIELFLPLFNKQLGLEITFWSNYNLQYIIIQLVGLFLMITILAGLYPAKILSNYEPASVLKGTFFNSIKAVAVRNLLIVIQFAVSIILIITIGIMQKQLSFINHKDLGFDRTRVINISSNYDEKVVKRIKRITGVEYVGATTQVIGNTYAFADKISFMGKKMDINMVTVTMEAFQALGIPPLTGRLFSPLYKQDTINTVVLNESAAKQFGGNVVGKQFTSYENTFQIIGVIKDYHAESFDKSIIPTIYKVTYLGGMSANGNLLVRFSSDNYASTIDKIEEIWKFYYPNYPMHYESLNETFYKSGETNKRFIDMIILFSIVSVLLSVLGLFALSTFVTKRRTKEIAIRKVLGASNIQIINMLNRSFLILVIVANLISWPIAYIFTNRWLNGFAYRIPIPVLPFIIATLLSIIVAVLTVSIQARKAAVTDPVNALKYE